MKILRCFVIYRSDRGWSTDVKVQGKWRSDVFIRSSVMDEKSINLTWWFLAASHLAIAAYCYARSGVVSLSVCLLVTFVSPSKTAEPIEMPCGVVTLVGPRKHVLDGGQSRTNPFAARGDKTAMWSFIRILHNLFLVASVLHELLSDALTMSVRWQNGASVP